MTRDDVIQLIEQLEDYMWECNGEVLRCVLSAINAIKDNENID